MKILDSSILSIKKGSIATPVFNHLYFNISREKSQEKLLNEKDVFISSFGCSFCWTGKGLFLLYF